MSHRGVFGISLKKHGGVVVRHRLWWKKFLRRNCKRTMQAISLENIETYEKFDQGEVTVMMTKKNEDASLTG